MSESGRFIANSFEQVLLGIARGLRDAQSVLDDMPKTDTLGRPQSGYHVPYLDFTLQATVEANLPGAQPMARGKPLIPQLLLRLPDAQSSQNASAGSTQLTSTFSGRLVSVPPNQNLPGYQLQAREIRKTALKRELEATLRSNAGDLINEANVEFNLDIETSLALSQAAELDIDAERLRSAMTFTQRIDQTDDDGIARVSVTLKSGLPAELQLLVLVVSGSTMTQLILTP